MINTKLKHFAACGGSQHSPGVVLWITGIDSYVKAECGDKSYTRFFRNFSHILAERLSIPHEVLPDNNIIVNGSNGKTILIVSPYIDDETVKPMIASGEVKNVIVLSRPRHYTQKSFLYYACHTGKRFVTQQLPQIHFGDTASADSDASVGSPYDFILINGDNNHVIINQNNGGQPKKAHGFFYDFLMGLLSSIAADCCKYLSCF